MKYSKKFVCSKIEEFEAVKKSANESFTSFLSEVSELQKCSEYQAYVKRLTVLIESYVKPLNNLLNRFDSKSFYCSNVKIKNREIADKFDETTNEILAVSGKMVRITIEMGLNYNDWNEKHQRIILQ